MKYFTLVESLLLEGYFYVPKSAYKELYDYAMEMYRKYNLSITKRVTDASYPPKVFDLKLKGTQWEFLQYIIGPVKVSFTSGGNNSFYRHRFGAIPSDIVLNLSHNSTKPHLFIDTIEHEVLHHIQFTLILHKKYKDKIPRDFGYQPLIGGLPPKTFIPSDINYHGHKKDSLSSRRVAHTNRPIEYYPDLLSAIRKLQYGFFLYERQQLSYSDETPQSVSNDDVLKWWETAQNDTQRKKEFFHKFIKSLSSNSTKKDLSVDIFLKFKRQGDEFFKQMVKLAYDAFVNRSWNFSPVELYNISKDLNKILVTKLLRKSVSEHAEFVFSKSSLSVSVYGNLFDYVDRSRIPIEDGMTASTVVILEDELNIRETSSNTFNLPTKENGIRRLFSKLKKLKTHSANVGNQYPLTLSGEEQFTPDMLNELHDSIFKYLKDKYLNSIIAHINVYDIERKRLENLIDTSYNL